MPACVYTPNGLAEFIFAERWRRAPEPGDVVFYNFSTKQTDKFSMPHVGIVVDVAGWDRYSKFQAVEGGVDGSVALMVRSGVDTIGFGRPVFKSRPGMAAEMQTGPVFVRVDRVRLGASGRDVLNVQLALEQVGCLSEYTPAVFDAKTERGYIRWQRLIGHVGPDADGVPSAGTLDQLGERTGVFRIFSLSHATEN